MARPRHRLDLVIVPADPDRLPDAAAFAAREAAWREAPETLVPGGFADLRLDRPQGRALYSNQLGGFQVRCPSTGTPTAKAFSRAVEAWRAGAAAVLADCPACGAAHALGAMDCRPPVALGRGAVVLMDAATAALVPGAAAALAPVVGPGFQLVFRRP